MLNIYLALQLLPILILALAAAQCPITAPGVDPNDCTEECKGNDECHNGQLCCSIGCHLKCLNPDPSVVDPHTHGHGSNAQTAIESNVVPQQNVISPGSSAVNAISSNSNGSRLPDLVIPPITTNINLGGGAVNNIPETNPFLPSNSFVNQTSNQSTTLHIQTQSGLLLPSPMELGISASGGALPPAIRPQTENQSNSSSAISNLPSVSNNVDSDNAINIKEPLILSGRRKIENRGNLQNANISTSTTDQRCPTVLSGLGPGCEQECLGNDQCAERQICCNIGCKLVCVSLEAINQQSQISPFGNQPPIIQQPDKPPAINQPEVVPLVASPTTTTTFPPPDAGIPLLGNSSTNLQSSTQQIFKVWLTTDTVAPVLGSSVNLHCHTDITSIESSAIIRWIRDGNVISETPEAWSLHFVLKPEFQGAYQCEIQLGPRGKPLRSNITQIALNTPNNQQTQQQQQQNVQQQKLSFPGDDLETISPLSIHADPSPDVPAGTKVNLFCVINENEPELLKSADTEFLWLHEGEEVQKQTGHDGAAHSFAVTVQTQGTYECRARIKNALQWHQSTPIQITVIGAKIK